MPYLCGATWKFKMKSYLHDKGIKGQSIVNQKIYIKYTKFCKLSSNSAYRYKWWVLHYWYSYHLDCKIPIKSYKILDYEYITFIA